MMFSLLVFKLGSFSFLQNIDLVLSVFNYCIFCNFDGVTPSLCSSGHLCAGHVALHHTRTDRSLAQADLGTAQREVQARDGKL